MVPRKRHRPNQHLSILERFTQRRLKSLRATTGCEIFAIEKETSLTEISAQLPSISIINSERTLTKEELELLPRQSQLLHLVDTPGAGDAQSFLRHSREFDATVLLRDPNLDASIFIQSLLYGMSHRLDSLFKVPFSRWGAACDQQARLSTTESQHLLTNFYSKLDIGPTIIKQFLAFLGIFTTRLSKNGLIDSVEMTADGCHVSLKLRAAIENQNGLCSDLLALQGLATGINLCGKDVEILMIQKQRPAIQLLDGPCLFLYYSPRPSEVATTLEEAG